MGLKQVAKTKEEAREAPEVENGRALSEDQLDAITGGMGFHPGFGNNQAPWDTQAEQDDTMNEVLPATNATGDDEYSDTITVTL